MLLLFQKCAFYTSCLGTSLYYHLKKHVKEWYTTPMYKDHPDLYIIIIADQRSVLLVYQDDVDLVTFPTNSYFEMIFPFIFRLQISLFDSHTHLENGAVIAQVPRIRLKALCFWFAGMIQEYFKSDPDCYELSFLYYSHQSFLQPYMNIFILNTSEKQQLSNNRFNK